ncbi:MAG: transposase [Gemmatimonadaceae bacterium]
MPAGSAADHARSDDAPDHSGGTHSCTCIGECSASATSPSASPLWETLETSAREQIQHFVQRLLEEEVEALLGWAKSERRTEATPAGYRNGYGTPRQLARTSGTITVQRPRGRDLEDRFMSRVLPRFQRRTREVGALLPERYLPLPARALDRGLRACAAWAAPRAGRRAEDRPRRRERAARIA